MHIPEPCSPPPNRASTHARIYPSNNFLPSTYENTRRPMGTHAPVALLRPLDHAGFVVGVSACKGIGGGGTPPTRLRLLCLLCFAIGPCRHACCPGLPLLLLCMLCRRRLLPIRPPTAAASFTGRGWRPAHVSPANGALPPHALHLHGRCTDGGRGERVRGWGRGRGPG
jgi:hypothetical protein